MCSSLFHPPQAMSHQKLSWAAIGKPEHPLLSPAAAFESLVFTAGQVGAEEDGSFAPDVVRQTELAIADLQKVLKASGSDLDEILKVLLFVRNPEDAAKVNEVYAKHITTKPARSCISVVFPHPDILVEIEAIAVKKHTANL